jgi:hypothetical protein
VEGGREKWTEGHTDKEMDGGIETDGQKEVLADTDKRRDRLRDK